MILPYVTKNFTGAIAAGTDIVAAPGTGKQILVTEMIVTDAKAESGKVLKIYENGGSATPFLVISLGTVGSHPFRFGSPEKGDHLALTANKALEYEADSTTGNTNCSILTNYRVMP